MEHMDHGTPHLRRRPAQGPRILFFSGGTALRGAARALIRHTHNSIHLVTPFDSGGSSAVIRQAFDMPAVGDIRNRLLALADRSDPGVEAVFALFAHRFPKDAAQTHLLLELESMADGDHPLVRAVPDPKRTIILVHFHRFLEAMPRDFDLRGASLGNLFLSAGYLTAGRRMDPAVASFSMLANVCGTVRPTLNRDLHLAARLHSGQVIVGQHLLTGKEAGPLSSPVQSVWLTASPDSREPIEPSISDTTARLIAEADLICFPPGSFYSSIVANLLPTGVGTAVAANPCPKVFIPNTVPDPENLNLGVADQAQVLDQALRHSGAPTGKDGLTAMLVDSKNGTYPLSGRPLAAHRKEVDVLDRTLISSASTPLLDPDLLIRALLSLA